MPGVPKAVSKTNVTARVKGDMRPKSELHVYHELGRRGAYRLRRRFVPINREATS